MPYTTSVAGTTITASWANANVRDQVVTPFASTSALASAITAPVVGMTEYISSNDANEGLLTRSSAAQWRKPWNMSWGAQSIVSRSTDIASGASGAYIDLMTTPAFTALANRYYQLTVTMPYCSNTSGASITAAAIFTDDANTLLGYAAYTAIAASTGIAMSATVTVVLSASASRTIKMRGSASGGTAWTLGAATAGAQLTVIDVGPAGAPS